MKSVFLRSLAVCSACAAILTTSCSPSYNSIKRMQKLEEGVANPTTKEELAAAEPSVIISRRPCALLKHVKHKPPLVVDKDKCIGCKSCMRIGCPAISMVDGKARVDQTQCVGCGVCSQLCPKKAFASSI